MNTEQAAAVIDLALGDYAAIRDEYRSTLYSAILSYFDSTKSVTVERNRARRAVIDNFYPAAELGVEDGGGEAPLMDDDLTWINGRADAERANIDALFNQLKEMRKDPEFTRDDAFSMANLRADNYAKTLDSIYSEAKVRGAKNQMLTFGGQDGHAPEFPCPECKKLKGQRHRAKWWISRGLVPYPGNPNFTCGTWQCKHFLFNDKGQVFTI